MILATLQQWNLNKRRIFVRADLNVPFVNGAIADDFLIGNALITIDYIINHGGSIVLATHLKNSSNTKLSTKLLVPWFEQRGYSIIFIQTIPAIFNLPIIPKQIILIENLRFFPEEKNGDPFFAKQLARTAHYYINDAFSAANDSDCSLSLLPYEFPQERRSIGLLVEKELYALAKLRDNPARPFIAILGGEKIEDKLPLIYSLINNVDAILLGPPLCFSFLKALGKPIGQSFVNDAALTSSKKIILTAEQTNTLCVFPVDYSVAFDATDKSVSIVQASLFPESAIGLSIGPETVALFSDHINHAKTIVLNGTMGCDNNPEAEESTKKIITAIGRSCAHSVITGSNAIALALKTPHYQSIGHFSTGDDAALAYLTNTLLPGLTPFEEE